MKQIRKNFILLVLVSIFVLGGIFGLHDISYGQEYTLLEPLGGIETVPTGPGGFGSYLGKIFQFTIGIAGVLAVLMIVIGGIQYMTSEAFTSKEDAKKRIWAAIWGLLLAIASFLILNTINPNLLNLSLDIPGADLISLPPPEQTGTGSGYALYDWAVIPEATTIGSSLYCRDIKGDGWVNVDARFCGKTKPSPNHECCAFQ